MVATSLGLADLGRVLMLDRRGTGLSDCVREVQAAETSMDDIRSVMEVVGSEQAALSRTVCGLAACLFVHPCVGGPTSAYTLAVRRNLQLRELGDLLDRPLNAVLGLHRQGGSILLTPVWHLFNQGSFYIQVPGGDRKIAMLKRDPRCSILVAENEHPYRAIEARGEGRLSTDDYPAVGPEIVRRYVEAYDPGAKVPDYLLEGGVIVRIEPTAIRAWDYADAAYV